MEDRDLIQWWQRIGDLRFWAMSRSPRWIAETLLGRVRRWAWSREVMTVYRADHDPAAGRGAPFRPLVSGRRWDALEDFTLYSGSDWRLSRQAIVTLARRRLVDGEHSFTVVENGVLAHYHWLQLDQSEIRFPEVGTSYPLPPGSAVSYGAYTEPRLRGRGHHRLSARETVLTAFALGADRIFSGAMETNIPSRRSLEGAGYRPVARIICVRLLGARRLRVEPAGID